MKKLNIGAGGKLLDGYDNIDLYAAGCIKMDACDLKYEDNSIDEIVSFHMIEHVSRQDAEKMLKHWYKKIKYGGLLIWTGKGIYFSSFFLSSWEKMRFFSNRISTRATMYSFSRALSAGLSASPFSSERGSFMPLLTRNPV